MTADQTSDNGQLMSRAFWVTGPGQGAVMDTPVGAGSESSVLVRALYSGVSRGTESLVFHGQVPEGEYERMRAPFQEGRFPFPVKYGYASVGEVVQGCDALLGRRVFCLFPHQALYAVPEQAVVALPDDLPAGRAVLAANMETAINGLWDAAPAVGDRIAVVGLGVVGLLTAWLASRIPGTRVTALDVNPGRRAVADALGLRFATACDRDDHDLVIHASGQGAGLATALALAGQEARVVEMSWYGDQAVTVPLGGAFHSRRLTLRSSQVGQIRPSRQPRWTHRDRLSLALSLLRDDRLDALITGESAFDDMPEALGSVLTDGRDTLCHRIHY